MTPVLALSLWMTLAQPAPATVSIDLRPIPEKSYRELDGLALERKLTLRLIQEGFAVVSFDQAEVDIRLTLRPAPHGWLIDAEGRLGRRSRTVTVGKKTPLAELQLELTQKASELAREARPPPRPAAVEAPPPPLAAPSPPPEPVPPPSPPPPSPWLHASLVGAATWREGGVDPTGLLRLAATGERIGGLVELGESLSQGPSLRISETQLAAGVSFTLVRSQALALGVALEGGALFHHYEDSDPFATDRSGTRTLVGAWVPFTLQWALSRHVSLLVRAATGFTPALTHESEGETLWARGPVRVELGAGIDWGF